MQLYRGFNTMLRLISYYNKSISAEGFEKALDEYLDYMETNNQIPEFSQEDYEISCFEDIEETTLSHVIYHAELNGFPVDDYMI